MAPYLVKVRLLNAAEKLRPIVHLSMYGSGVTLCGWFFNSRDFVGSSVLPSREALRLCKDCTHLAEKANQTTRQNDTYYAQVSV